MGNRKYLFFDFDGTVFEGKKYAPETVAAMRKAQAAGYWLILNTGRSQGHFDATPEGKACPIRWDARIYGMSDVVIGERAVQRIALGAEKAMQWAVYARENGIYFWLEGQKRIVKFPFHDPELRGKIGSDRELREAMDADTVTKVILIAEYDEQNAPKGDWTVHTDRGWFEVTVRDRQKGTAIRDFCRLTGADLADCVCFGDAFNDLDMFQTCPVGICMKAAPKELSDLAAYHATGEHGVAEGIEWLLEREKSEKKA